MGRKHFLLITVCIIMTTVLLIGGCGSTGSMSKKNSAQSTSRDIDELLGLSNNDDTENFEDEDNINEENVLRLLGVVDENDDIEMAGKENQISAVEQNQSKFNRYQYDNTETKDLSEKNSNFYEKSNMSFPNSYKDAFQSYNARRYKEAIQKFSNLLSVKNNHALSDNCQYWIGESYYALGDFEQSIIAFEKVFLYTKSNKDDDAQLKLGICYIRLNQRDKARKEFQRLITNYPNSEFLSVARNYLNKLN